TIQLLTGGNIVATGKTTTLGTRPISVQAGSTINTSAVSGGSGATGIQYTAGGAITVDGNILATSTGIIFNRSDFILAGTSTVNVGTQQITLAPIGTSATIGLGGVGGGTQFDLSSIELSRMTASTLNIGDKTVGGGIT